jgi:hypothetical protein
LACNVSSTAKSAKTFIRKTHAVWPIIADAPERLLDTTFGKNPASIALCYMQDGVNPHTSKVVLDFLNTDFGHQVMSNRPDMNPCDFFIGFLDKEIVSIKTSQLI